MWENSTRNLNQNGANALEQIKASIRIMKELQIEMNAFNCSQQYIIFGLKLTLLGCVIFSGFTAIQFYESDRFLGLCNALIATEGTFVFLFCYDRGFSVPRSIARVQRSLMLRLRQSESISDTQRAYVTKQLSSMRKMAIQVGNFHYLQRASTPRFFDFCVKNTVRLVMSYRRSSLYR